jgi:hypothetical protein
VHGELVEMRRVAVAEPGHRRGPGRFAFGIGAADGDGADQFAVQLGHEALALGGAARGGLGRLRRGGEVHAQGRQRAIGVVQQRGQHGEGIARGQRPDVDAANVHRRQ